MIQIEKVLYTAKAHTTGGRDGASRTNDGRLDVKLSSPGSAGNGTNPEQLFAAGWSACFMSAIALAASQQKVGKWSSSKFPLNSAGAWPRRTRMHRKPQRAAAAAVCLQWFDCAAPRVMSVSAPAACASATSSSSLRVLLPP